MSGRRVGVEEELFLADPESGDLLPATTRTLRAGSGEAPPLQPGFAGLYRALGLPVVPVAHDVGRLWHKGFLKKSGTAHFKVGEVIPAGLKRPDVETRVHRAINALN